MACSLLIEFTNENKLKIQAEQQALGYHLEERGSTNGEELTWLVAKRACLTYESMQKKGINIALRCILCKKALETSKHFFLLCEATAQVWELFSLANMNWSMPENKVDLLSCWIIWKERNQRIFQGKECSVQNIKWKLITTLGFWCKE